MRKRVYPIVLIAVLVAIGAAGAATVEFDGKSNDIQGFVPGADSVWLQKVDRAAGYNVRVVVDLGADGLDRLKAHQGFTGAFAIGGGDQEVVFEDLGRGPDEVAGDGLYSVFASIDLEALADHAAAGTRHSGELGPVFEGRVLVGHGERTAFDMGGFEAGAMVPFARRPTPIEDDSRLPTRMVTLGTNAFQDSVLMITHPAVVADPARTFDPCTGAGTPLGAWTFGRVFVDLANQMQTGIDPAVLAEQWLNHWLSNQTINTFTVPQRQQMQLIINDWRAASGGGLLNLKIAPFRLLAIVPRIDLRDSLGLNAGEARFVFGVVIPDTYRSLGSFVGSQGIPGTDTDYNGSLCEALRFSVITEFRVPSCGCEDQKAWAKRWAELSTLPFAGTDYLQALEKLTTMFSGAGSDTQQPNSSALGQLRTNEIAIDPIPHQFLWELREFRLTVFPHSLLNQTTTADSPDDSFNGTATFFNFVVGGGGQVPLFFAGAPFLGGNPQVPPTHWDAPGLVPAFANQRFAASIATCNGCHFAETGTTFVHVDPNTPGLPATLSGFLTGINGVPDPAGSGQFRDFDDLARREKDLKSFLDRPCGTVIMFPYQGSTSSDDTLALDPLTAPEDAVRVSLSLDGLVRDPVTHVH